jgi:tetratricopeptide (TPR) repeat protein
MRMRPLFLLLSFACAAIAGADDLLGPADYLKILSESKLHYNITTQPAKTPMVEMQCPRRDESTRLVSEGKGKRLVNWAVKPEAMKLLAEGETLYGQKDYAGASEKYRAAIDADPAAVTAYYFYGDALLFGVNDPASALVQYRKGLALDPTMPSGHLFASTALVQLGRRDEAREEIVQALLYYPGYESVWELAAQPKRWNAKPIVRHPFDVPAGYVGVKGSDGIDIYAGADMKWLGYAMCKAVWANEKSFAKKHKADGWSNEEEQACVLNQLMGDYNATEAAIEETKKKSGEAQPAVTKEEVIAALSPFDRHLWDVAQDRMLEGYVFFEIIGQHCPLSMSMMSDETKQEVEKYIRKYVIVPAQ